MFETNESVRSMIDRLWDVCGSLDRGDILSHEVIRDILGCEPHTPPWPHCMKVVRRRLQKERGIATLPDRTYGYKFLTQQETLTRLPQYRTKKAGRQFRWTRQSLESLPESGLSPRQRQARMMLIESVRRAEVTTRSDLRDQVQLTRATPVPPRRPRPAPAG
jgi:hypothetical protein